MIVFFLPHQKSAKSPPKMGSGYDRDSLISAMATSPLL